MTYGDCQIWTQMIRNLFQVMMENHRDVFSFCFVSLVCYFVGVCTTSLVIHKQNVHVVEPFFIIYVSSSSFYSQMLKCWLFINLIRLFYRLRLQYGISLRTEKSTISIRRLNINLIVVLNELVTWIFCHDSMSWVIWNGNWYYMNYKRYICNVCTGKSKVSIKTTEAL